MDNVPAVESDDSNLVCHDGCGWQVRQLAATAPAANLGHEDSDGSNAEQA